MRQKSGNKVFCSYLILLEFSLFLLDILSSVAANSPETYFGSQPLHLIRKTKKNVYSKTWE